jgi:hypothetical protein
MPNIAAHDPQSYNFHIFLTVLEQILGQPNCASPVYVPVRHASWHICSSCVTELGALSQPCTLAGATFLGVLGYLTWMVCPG